MNIKLSVLILSSLLLSACTSAFEANYKPSMQNISALNSYEYCNEVRVEKIPEDQDIIELKAHMERLGYALLGESRWESSSTASNQSALEQGQRVGACLVLWRQASAGIVSTTRMVPEYIPSRTNTIVVDGQVTTITIPSETYYHQEPVIYEEYDYVGLFYAKIKSGTKPLGLDVASPSNEYMAKNDSRNGLLVLSVANNGPAYNANIFPNDIILKVNGKDVKFGTEIPLIFNQENDLVIDRNGEILKKKITPSQTF